ncbi:MAG: heavy metal-associated domain-containing protein, partial [Pseudomonadota bacterium]
MSDSPDPAPPQASAPLRPPAAGRRRASAASRTIRTDGNLREAPAPVDARAPLAATARRVDLTVDGMHCASCVARVERALRDVPGVETASVNLPARRA